MVFSNIIVGFFFSYKLWVLVLLTRSNFNLMWLEPDLNSSRCLGHLKITLYCVFNLENCFNNIYLKVNSAYRPVSNFGQHFPITCNRVCKWTQYVTSNNVRSCWPTMLPPFARGFTIMSCKLFCLCVPNSVFWLDLSLVFKLRAKGRKQFPTMFMHDCVRLGNWCANGCNNSQQLANNVHANSNM